MTPTEAKALGGSFDTTYAYLTEVRFLYLPPKCSKIITLNHMRQMLEGSVTIIDVRKVDEARKIKTVPGTVV